MCVLEYYKGILIMTSNRVGTYDEAFKSRIQLSLHYESLDKSQRRTIWENFLDRLGTLEEENSVKKTPLDTRKRKLESGDIDFNDIHRHLAELAAHEINGREIRNAITMGRQLAKFKYESMSYKHLKYVIGVSRKFNKYLESGDYTNDQNAWGARYQVTSGLLGLGNYLYNSLGVGFEEQYVSGYTIGSPGGRHTTRTYGLDFGITVTSRS